MPPTNQASYNQFTQPVQPAPQPRGSMKNAIQNIAAGTFIVCIVVLSAISIFGVWNFFDTDVIKKSFQTIGLLAFVAIVVIVAGNFVGDHATESTIVVPNPAFRMMRNTTLTTLIAASSFLALLGVLSIWEVITDKKVLGKSLSSLAIIAFSSLIIVVMCLEREKGSLWEKRGREVSGGAVIAAIVFIYIMLAFWG